MNKSDKIAPKVQEVKAVPTNPLPDKTIAAECRRRRTQ
jgi:hypothetical protein